MEEQHIFRYMDTVRDYTIKTVSEIPEEHADLIPTGFNNNIRWNLGHIAFIQDRVMVKQIGAELGVPKLYKLLFGPGTRPTNWQFPAPSMSELIQQLDTQKFRMRELLSGRLDEKIDPAFTTGTGLTFYTVGECFLFTTYHEGLHMEVIKRINLASS